MTVSDALVDEMMLQLAKVDPDSRDQLVIAVAAVDVSKELEGVSVTMAPGMAEAVGAIVKDDNAREGLQEAYSRIQKLKNEREPPKGKVPTELTALVFWSVSQQVTEALAYEYVREAVGSRYGSELPAIRDFKLANLTDHDPSEITTDVAHVFYSLALKRGGIVPDYGKPDDGHAGTTADGTRFAALFFWHDSKKGGGAKKKLSLFGRG